MRAMVLFVACCLTGCATHRPAENATHSEAAAPVTREEPPVVITRYELSAYRYPRGAYSEQISTVYRRTRVPSWAVASTLSATPPVGAPTYAPLPPSTELAAELSTQRRITSELRAIHAALLAMEQQARRQYGSLLANTAETSVLHAELERERARVRELEAQLSVRIRNPVTTEVSNRSAETSPNEGVKW